MSDKLLGFGPRGGDQPMVTSVSGLPDGRIVDEHGRELRGDELVEQCQRVILTQPMNNGLVAIFKRLGELEAALEKLAK